MDFLIHHMLSATVEHSPEKEALVHGSQRITYKEVWEKVSGLAHALNNDGVERGDRVGIYLEASIAQVFSIFGISIAGAVFVPINIQLFPDQVAHIAND
jgi:acyl-CoA synthetase (AMP-forming)/AMP-acid ligase II